MRSKIDPRIHIGEQYGVFIIEDVLSEKDKYGHWIYKGVCQECGFEKFGTYGYIKSKIINQCTHVHKYEIKNCLYCGKEIPIKNLKPSQYNKKKFCNKSCAASYNNQGVRRNYKNEIRYNESKQCLNCGNEIPGKNTYCSNKCRHEYEQKIWEAKWFAGEVSGNINPVWTDISKRVRTYLFNKYDNKCSQCGWGEMNPYTGTIPLEVEHIDGDPYNTVPDNVTLLCPNCHSLTSTYRGANKGNGRKKLWIPKPIEVEI